MVFISGIVLLVLGYVLGIGILTTLGIVAIAVGALLWLFGAVVGPSRPVPGRRYWGWPW